NINYSTRFPDKPFNLSLAARHSQNSLTRNVSVTLPDLSFNMTRVYLPGPDIFKKIGISSSLNAKNEISVPDSIISINNLPNLGDEFKYGVRNSLRMDANYRVFKYMSLNPNFSSNQILYFNQYNQ